MVASGRDRVPVNEAVLTVPSESFVWRRDDYPLPLSVWNAHPECEIHLIAHAEGTCFIGDHVGPFGPGDLYMVGPDLAHNWLTPLQVGEVIAGRDTVLQFDAQKLREASKLLPELRRIEPLLGAARRGIVFHGKARETGARLIEEIGAYRGMDRLTRFLDLLNLLSGTSEYTCLASPDFHQMVDERTGKVLAEIFEHMGRNLSDPFRLSDAARIAGMTETSFSRFFKAKTGNTFSHHVRVLRTGKACELLARTDMPVTQICGEAGYDNLSNFNRAFRIVHGMTPSAYRDLARS